MTTILKEFQSRSWGFAGQWAITQELSLAANEDAAGHHSE
jgi:hypothetical protein